MATYNAGAIESTLTLDRRPFQQGMKLAQAQGRAFERQKYTAKLDADTSAATRKIAELRARLDELTGKPATVDVDVDTGSAEAQLAALKSRLDAVDRDHVEPGVDVDTAEAMAQIEALKAEADSLDRDRVALRVDTAGFTNASIAMQLLVAGAAALSPILVPTLAAGAAAALGLGAALGTAAAGLPVLALGFGGVFGAVRALSQQQTAAVGSTRSLASSQGQLQSAVRSLANARANAADQAVAAAERVRNAEQSLRQAEQAEQVAVRALSQARVEARQHLQDLAFATEDADLALRDANLQVREAKAALDALSGSAGDASHAQAQLVEAQTAYQNLLANPEATEAQRELAAAAIVAAERQVQAAQAGTSATALQRQQAQLAYDEAVQRQREATVAAQRAAADQADAQRKGIAGSDAVVAAEQKIADAQRQVQQAQQSLADAERAQASQRRQSAYAIAQAQQAVADAQRQVAQSSTGAAGGLSQVQKAMDKLSPAGRRFALFLFSLRGYWRQLQATAQAGLLPGVEKGIRAMLPLMPDLILFVKATSKAFGDLFTQAGKALNAPFWHGFTRFLAATAGPNIKLFGTILGNLATAAAALTVAFEPLGHALLQWLVEATGKFATWSASLSSSKGFKDFVSYVRREGPKIAALLLAFGNAVYRLGVALAPYADKILTFLTGLFDTLGNFFDKHKRRDDAAGLVKMLTDLAAVLAGGLVRAVNDAARNVDWQVIGRIFGDFAKRLAVILAQLDWGAILKGAGQFLLGVIASWFGDTVADGFRQGLQNIVTAAKALFTPPLWLIGKAIVEGIRDGIGHWWGIFVPGAQFARLIEEVKKLLGISSPSTVFFGIGADVIRGFVNGLLSLAGAPPHALSGIINASLDRFAGAGRWLYGRGQQIVNGLIDGLNSRRGAANQSVSNLVDGLLGRWNGLRNTRSAAQYVVNDVMRRLVREFNQVADAFGGKMVALPKFKAGGPVSHFKNDPGGGGKGNRPSQLAVGGAIRGPGTGTSDSIPALLSNGEHVWTAREVAGAGGHAAVESLRRGAAAGQRVPGFAGGGPVTTDPEGSFKDDAKQTLAMVSNFTSTAFLRTLARIPHKVADLAVAHLHKLLASFVGNFTGQGIPVTAKGPIVDIVRRTAAQFGWGSGAEWAALVQIINHESGWNPLAQNPRSTAFGLGQFLDSTWRTVGGHKTTNPALQALYLMRYIGQSYHDPIGAWRFWSSHHWYDTGGIADGPGALFKGPGKEAVLSPEQTSAWVDLVPHLTALANAFASGELAGQGMTVNVTQNAAPGLTSEQDLERLMRKVETRLRVGRRS